MPEASHQAFIGVGSNLGDRWGTVRRALAALAREPGIRALEGSEVYETAPVGMLDQPPFLNLVAGVETTLTPEALLAVLQAQERAAGRLRDQARRWGPRTLDLDLLLYEGETRGGPGLILPHPRIWERAFVTVPLRELLNRAGRFRNPAWDEVRARLAPMPAGPGVAPWTPPEE